MRHTATGVANERPSRVSRVAVILSTLGVASIAAWVFAPMLLASHTASVPAAPKPRTVAQQPVHAPPPAPSPPGPPKPAPRRAAAGHRAAARPRRDHEGGRAPARGSHGVRDAARAP